VDATSRVLALLVLCGPHPGGEAQGVRLTGHVTILEKGNRPSPDLGAAVVYLERGAPVPARRGGGGGAFEIAISDKEFVPRVMVVPLGATVLFPNHDPFNHNVFSVSEPNQFDLGLYGRGEAKGRTLTSAGLVRVFCNIHPRMAAFVQVMATRYFTQPTADGSFAIDAVPPGRYTLHVWHERSTQVAQQVTVGPQGSPDLAIALDARGFHWTPHKNKYGKDYPTNAGRERY
jgi:plastocyanin